MTTTTHYTIYTIVELTMRIHYYLLESKPVDIVLVSGSTRLPQVLFLVLA